MVHTVRKNRKKGDLEKNQEKSVKIRQNQEEFFLVCRNLYFPDKVKKFSKFPEFLGYFVLNFNTLVQ